MAIRTLGPFRLDTQDELLFCGSERVALGRRAIALLRVLVERPGAVVSKDALITAAWPHQAVEESNLTVQIAALRRILSEAPGGDRWIETMPRRGYRYVGPVITEPQTDRLETSRPVDTKPALSPVECEQAERRQITAMSCEMIGFKSRATVLDHLEDRGEAIEAFQRCVSATTARHNGFIARYFGSTLLILFGYPAAHEDDAEQAVQAGLELRAAVRSLKGIADAPMRCRLGIATGLVIVGNFSRSAESRDLDIVGGIPELASRLQISAEPDTVVIESTTRHLLGDLFECRDLDAIVGSDCEAVQRWQVLQERAVESRFEALHGSGLTALVGREEETELLLRRWLRSKSGEGQVVLLSGEAGIGKSRLTAALLEHLAGEPHTRLRYFCSPQHTDSALYPIIGQMERAAGLAHDDKPQAKLDKLDTLLLRTSTSIEDSALFAEMLSLPNDGRYPALALLPEQRRQRTLDALMAQLQALTRSSPVLMILEDAHWTDPTSLELFGRVVDRIRNLRVLLIVTFRPEFESPWIGRPHVTALTINRLAQREIDAMIDRVVGNASLPANIRRDIIERTDGIPLFVEEMTKAVLEAGNDSAAEYVAAAVPHPGLAVPASLHASLMARLDRLGPAKELAQIGAAIGREFSHALLVAVVSKPEAELASALGRLVAAGLLFRQGVPPHTTYLFKHALVQDAGYGTLLREPRRALHARIAETLESQFADIAESQPELLARHCTEAGLIEKAAGLWGKAGQQSQARSALVEAAAHLTRALNQIATLPSTPALRREQIKLQVALIIPLNHTKGHAASETKAAAEQARLLIEQAEALGEPPEDPLLLLQVLYGFWVANLVAFNGDAIRELAVQFLALAGKQRATVPLMIGHRLMGFSLLSTGDIVEGRAHLDQAIALYDPADRPLATRFGQDAKVTALSYRSLALWLLGYPEAALRDAANALKDAREMGQAATLMLALSHTTTLMLALSHTAKPYTLCGNYAVAAAQAQEQVALAEEKGSLFWKAEGMMNQGGVLALAGRASDAIEMLISGNAAFRATGGTLWMPLRLQHLARAHAELGQFEEAWRCIGEATTAVETTKEKWCEADIHRTAGEIALMSPEPDAAKAEAHFERAIAIARAQQAKSWELCATTSLARLWQSQGRRSEAHDRLAPIYSWFTEGFDTPDLREARAMLEELRSSPS